VPALTATLLLVPWLATPGGSQPAGIHGLWLSDDGRGAVRIAPCGGNVCGHIGWLRDKTRLDGGPLVDVHNPDPKQRLRAICGLQVIGALRRQVDGSWDQGWIYDPKVGKTYNVAVTAKDGGTLAVHGYLQTKILGKTYYWSRAPEGLQRCR
jgi:uncharacterized protein (DUF2147 family)